MSFVWQHVVLPALGFAIEQIPWWGWAVLFGVVCAIAWKVYKFLGWPGVVGIGLAVLTFGAYRQGWLNAVSRHNAQKFEPASKAKASRPTVFNPGKRKRRYNADLNLWEDVSQ